MRARVVVMAAVVLTLLGTQALPAPAAVTTTSCTVVPKDYYATYFDPIVYPGLFAFPPPASGSHWHTFFGSTGIDQNSTGPDLLDDPTTCADGNHSAFWTPQLFGGTGATAARLNAVRADVTIRARPGTPVPPVGLMQIAGNSRASSPDPHVKWTCPDGSASGAPRRCDDGFAYEKIQFQDCWDGEHLRGIGWGGGRIGYVQSHIAYSSGRACPAGWVKLPRLSVTFVFPTEGYTNLAVHTGGGETFTTNPFGGHADVIWGVPVGS